MLLHKCIMGGESFWLVLEQTFSSFSGVLGLQELNRDPKSCLKYPSKPLPRIPLVPKLS